MVTSRRTQKQRRADAEAALLTAAAELVDEQGVRALTLARVAERAGYSRGLVSHHFGSKQALVERLAHAAQAGFVPGLADLPPGLDRLLRLIDGYIARQARLSVLNRVFLTLWAESATSPELAPIFRQRTAAFLADLRADLTAGIADGTVDPATDPENTAVAVVAQLRGVAMQRLLDPEHTDSERLRTEITRHWHRALTCFPVPGPDRGPTSPRERSRS